MRSQARFDRFSVFIEERPHTGGAFTWPFLPVRPPSEHLFFLTSYPLLLQEVIGILSGKNHIIWWLLAKYTLDFVVGIGYNGYCFPVSACGRQVDGDSKQE